MSDAARRLGVSVKALRLYETRGLLVPPRTSSGYRVFDDEALARGGEIVALRRLGYEALASCLASPEVRARTAGVVARRAAVAQA